MSKKAILFWGGWDGHHPKKVAHRFAEILKNEGFEVRVIEGVENLPGLDDLKALDLLVPVTTGCSMDGNTSKKLSEAVASGVGIAGCHGGMCDSYRQDTEYQFMTGGQWVSHPGGDGVEYTVNVVRGANPLTYGIEDFTVKSEHYYLHVDPAIEVLASTRFPLVNYYHASNRVTDMPVVWTKFWAVGRVFYNSLGHHDEVFDESPSAQELMRRGMLWAAMGKEENARLGFSVDRYRNNAKMY